MDDHAYAEAKQNPRDDRVKSILSDPALDPLFWKATRIGQPSAWWTHVPFAHWIVTAAEPRLLVELGTHAGVSYSAFCHAVRTSGLPTQCWAVDTWQGDEHAGVYSEDVYNELRGFHDENYASFSGLLRSTFDEALPRFTDGSIDLLHIDGLHTYDAVRHDFESWLPKLSDRAVVMFHDINVLEGDFGVWRLWAELKERYPAFDFLHGHGLGVLGVGTKVPAAVDSLLQIRDTASLARVRARFSWLGERWLSETRERMMGARLHEQALAEQAQVAEVEQRRIAEAAALSAQLDQQKEAQRAAERRVELVEAMRIRSARRADAARAEAELATARSEMARAEAEAEARARAEAEAALAEARRNLSEKTDTDAVLHRAERDGAARRQAEVAQREAAQRAERESAARADAESERDRTLAEVARLSAELQALHRAHDALLNSTAWRVTYPFRRTGLHLPPRMRRLLRGAAKVAWWSASLQLPDKLRNRRAALMAPPSLAPAEPPQPQVTAALLPARAPSSVSVGRASNRAMRLVYISGEPDTPGHLYRVERPAAAARASGAEVLVVRIDEVSEHLTSVSEADALVLWRTPLNDKVAAAVSVARSAQVKIIFDVDDLMVDPSLAKVEVIDGIRSQDLPENLVASHFEQIRQAMLAADLCTASTDELARHMQRAWKPIRTLLNGFDHQIMAASRLAVRRWSRERDGLLRIGYAGGSRTHQRDFAVCAPAVAEVLRRFPEARLVAFRSSDGQRAILDVEEFPELRGFEDRVEWRNFVPLARLPEEMARFDINLAPLEVGNPFCEAKSELKYFEAALVDVPTIASPTGPFRRAIRDGETGFLAEAAEDWTQALLRLAGDAQLRRRVAADARRDVLWTYGPERRIEEMADFLDLLRGGRPGAVAFERLARRGAAPRALRASLPKIPAHEVLFDGDTLGSSKVTVIVPLYNYGRFVVEALDSVTRQTLPAIDLIVVDDASTDDSLEVALKWARANASAFNRLRVIRNLSNSGLALSRNVGFDLADTPWVLPLDADNRLRPRCAEQCLHVAEAAGVAYAFPIIQQFGDSTELMGVPPYDPVRLANGNYIDAMALISRAAWAAVGGYRHVVGGWEDFDLWCSFAERGLRGEQVPGEPLAEYRVHGTSMIRTASASIGRTESMIADLTRHHPWLTIVWPLAVPRPEAKPALRLAAVQTGDPSAEDSQEDRLRRLEAILPLLRCPDSGSRLRLSDDRKALVSEDGQCWPLVAGRPNLFEGLMPHINRDTHVSNLLPDKARALTLACSGPVLHLSAGGSTERFPNVVEAEAAVFRNTDVLADAHHLPFVDGCFDAVIAMNAFEHYSSPERAAQEILRVLAPGGRVLIRTAFLQPEHEAPWHFYNCTRFGLQNWFRDFETEELHVSENFHPGHSLAWLASACEAALRNSASERAADIFVKTSLGDFVSLWRMPEQMRVNKGLQSWSDLSALPQEAQSGIAAGFEFVGRKPM
jgi:glycosyltransferase involved in cell wall biosynthesis